MILHFLGLVRALCTVLGAISLVGTLALALSIGGFAASNAIARRRRVRAERRAARARMRQAIEDVIREPHLEGLLPPRKVDA